MHAVPFLLTPKSVDTRHAKMLPFDLSCQACICSCVLTSAYAGLYLLLLACICSCVLTSASAGLYLLLQACIFICWLVSASAGLHLLLQACIGFYRFASASAGLHLQVHLQDPLQLSQSIWRTAEQSCTKRLIDVHRGV